MSPKEPGQLSPNLKGTEDGVRTCSPAWLRTLLNEVSFIHGGASLLLSALGTEEQLTTVNTRVTFPDSTAIWNLEREAGSQ